MGTEKSGSVFIDGCFDMVHFGHANAMRQARSKGSRLVVGVHSDEEIIKAKGMPVLTSEERYEAVRAVKWVDHVHEASPYSLYMSTLDKCGCDFVVHGEDITLNADGEDCYSIAQRMGRFQFIHRTEGVSTSDIVNRVLARYATGFDHSAAQSKYTGTETFLPSARKIAMFSNRTEPEEHHTVVYVDGSFDLLHPGHLSWLRTLKESIPNAYIIAGIHSDEDVASYGPTPFLGVHERGLGVMGCRWVDDVIFNAPITVDKHMIAEFGINVVAVGPSGADYPVDGYVLPKEMGLLRTIEGPRPMSAKTIVDRIVARQAEYAAKNKAKAEKERMSGL